MKPFHVLQERFGFTRNETAVLLFLCVTLIAGSALRWYRNVRAEGASPLTAYDYAVADSLFAALSDQAAEDSSVAPPRKTPRRGATTDTLAHGEIDLNAADTTSLVRLPGVGPATARAIVLHRNQRGPFRSVDELLEVKGIGPKKLQRLRPYVTVR